MDHDDHNFENIFNSIKIYSENNMFVCSHYHSTCVDLQEKKGGE